MDLELLEKAKAYGFSDRQIAHLTGRTEDEVRAAPGGGAFSQDVIAKSNELRNP